MNALLRRLPAVRGRLRANAPAGRQTWFGAGGAAEVLFRPADAADLAGFLASLPRSSAVSVLGVGSNVLVRDGGIPGVTIRLGPGIADIRVEGEEISVGAGVLERNLACAAAAAGIGGL